MRGIHRTFHRRLPNGIFLWGGCRWAGFLCFSSKWARFVTGSLPKESQGNQALECPPSLNLEVARILWIGPKLGQA